MPAGKPVKPKKVYFPQKKIKGLAKGMTPGQWNKLKVFLRTGEKQKGLRIGNVDNFLSVFLDYKEAVNARRRNPYTARFSAQEKTEIRRQIRDAINILAPRSLSEETHRVVALLEKTICDKFEPVQRKHVNLYTKNKDWDTAFKTGQMYLDALDEKNATRQSRRAKKLDKRVPQRVIAFVESNYSKNRVAVPKRIVIGKNWIKRKSQMASPFHEATHAILGLNEYGAKLAECYYLLKRGVLTPVSLRGEYIIGPEAELARKKAVEIFKLGQQKGWKTAETKLRKEIGEKGKNQ